VNAEYNDLMRTAHQENRNGNPYNNSYTFTARGSQKVASKARKFIKAALLIGGAAGLAYFFRSQIGKHTTPILTSLGGKYTNLTRKPRAKYAAHKTRILKNANSTTPGFAGRTVQGWRSTRNGAASTYGKARNGIGEAYGKARNGIGEAYGAARAGLQSRYTKMMQPRAKPTFNQFLNTEANRRMRTLSQSVAGKPFPLTKLAHEQERGQTYENIIANISAKHAKSTTRAKRIRAGN